MKIRSIFLSIICLIVLFSPFFITINDNYELTEKRSVILSLAHIDEFEGGVGSRASFLIRRAEEFNKKHKNVFIEVCNITLEQLESDMNYDMISFSHQGAKKVYDKLKAYSGALNIRDEFIKSGASGEKVYAVAWCYGGYMMFEKPGKNSKVLSGSSYLHALPKGYTYESDSLSPTSAYEKFVSLKDYKYLLGTQRDAYKLEMRMSQSKIENVKGVCVEGYTNLTQYIGVLSDKAENISFIEYLTSDYSQKKLIEISMLNVNGLTLYSQGLMQILESGLLKNLNVSNVFVD